MRNSPKNSFLPVAGFRVNPTPVPGSIAGVAEHHHLHVHRGADVIGNVVDAAVFDRARIHPGPEHGIARHLQLVGRILWEFLAGFLFHDRLVLRHDLAKRGLVEVRIEFRVARFLHRVQLVLERVLRNLEDDVAEHLDEAAIAVHRKTPVLRARFQPLDGPVVQAQVENRVHHAGHRELRARPDRHEERVVVGAERGARGLLELLEMLGDLAIDRGRDPGFFPVVDAADVGRNREAGRHGQAGVGHLRQAGALAAEQVLHLPVAVGFAVAEKIHVLRRFLPALFPSAFRHLKLRQTSRGIPVVSKGGPDDCSAVRAVRRPPRRFPKCRPAAASAPRDAASATGGAISVPGRAT